MHIINKRQGILSVDEPIERKEKMVAKLAIIEVGPFFGQTSLGSVLDSELKFHDRPQSRIPQDREHLVNPLRDTLLTSRLRTPTHTYIVS